jgi:hypothetical protein
MWHRMLRFWEGEHWGYIGENKMLTAGKLLFHGARLSHAAASSLTEKFYNQAVCVVVCWQQKRGRSHFQSLSHPDFWTTHKTASALMWNRLKRKTKKQNQTNPMYHNLHSTQHYSPFAETRQRKQSKSRVATADSKERTKRAVSSVYSLHSDAR